MPPQRDEMGIAADATKPVQIQLQHKLSKSLCSQPSPGQTILAYERRTLECQHYQGRLGHRAIGEEGFPAISVENAVENNEFCGNRWKNAARRGCAGRKYVLETRFRSLFETTFFWAGP
jgi:hypothetical protein